jgi:hypothetical protein
MKEHKHHCPECFIHWDCNDEICTIELDLEEDGIQYGAHCECPICIMLVPCVRTNANQYELSAHTGNKTCQICNPSKPFIQMEIKLEKPVVVLDQNWFDKYNGIR